MVLYVVQKIRLTCNVCTSQQSLHLWERLCGPCTNSVRRCINTLTCFKNHSTLLTNCRYLVFLLRILCWPVRQRWTTTKVLALLQRRIVPNVCYGWCLCDTHGFLVCCLLATSFYYVGTALLGCFSCFFPLSFSKHAHLHFSLQ